jgi:DNA-binding NarL/FixJ family response regulator
MEREIDNRSYNLFCYGREVEDVLPPLTKRQTSVYNMVQAGFPYDAIARRLSIAVISVSARVGEIRKKGWEI